MPATLSVSARPPWPLGSRLAALAPQPAEALAPQPVARRGELTVTAGLRHAGPNLVRLRWETLGDPLLPAVVVLGGISADRHVASSEEFPEPGWWDAQVGPGRPIDPARHHVVAIDWVGADGSLDVPLDTADQADAVIARARPPRHPRPGGVRRLLVRRAGRAPARDPLPAPARLPGRDLRRDPSAPVRRRVPRAPARGRRARRRERARRGGARLGQAARRCSSYRTPAEFGAALPPARPCSTATGRDVLRRPISRRAVLSTPRRGRRPRSSGSPSRSTCTRSTPATVRVPDHARRRRRRLARAARGRRAAGRLRSARPRRCT